jgi:hypothetical protein
MNFILLPFSLGKKPTSSGEVKLLLAIVKVKIIRTLRGILEQLYNAQRDVLISVYGSN